MSKTRRIKVEQSDGRIFCIEDEKDIEAILAAMLVIKPTYTKTARIEELRNKYFAMLTELRNFTQTGYTKEDLHEQMKPLIFKKFADFPHYFTNNRPEYSTKYLNVDGWSATIDQLRSVANDVFNYTFKNWHGTNTQITQKWMGRT